MSMHIKLAEVVQIKVLEFPGKNEWQIIQG